MWRTQGSVGFPRTARRRVSNLVTIEAGEEAYDSLIDDGIHQAIRVRGQGHSVENRPGGFSDL